MNAKGEKKEAKHRNRKMVNALNIKIKIRFFYGCYMASFATYIDIIPKPCHINIHI